jgi:hypothetical protein
MISILLRRCPMGLILFALPTGVLPVRPTLVPAPAVVRRWDSTGHKTVARIAWDNMSAQARAGAVALLRHGPPLAGLGSLAPASGTPEQVDRGLFVETATWPDMIRDTAAAFHVYHHGNWHFTDFFWKKVGGAVVPLESMGPADTNAIERLNALTAVLRDPSVADSTRAVALAWILHLVGDIHQPLHMSSRVTTALPNGDVGGNSFKLLGKPNKLHAYWDDILDLSTPQSAGEGSAHYVDRLATKVEHTLPHATVSAATLHSQFDDWGAESLALAQQKVYPTTLKVNRKPSAAYRISTDKVAEKRVALAGYRLAELLNGVFP